MKGKDVSQMQQAKFPLEINGVASNLNQWISDEDQSQEPTWHIEKLIHPCLKLEKEQKKNMAYRSINFWLKIPISYYKQHFVFLSSANEGCILQKSIYVFCWTYYTWVSFIWFFFFLYQQIDNSAPTWQLMNPCLSSSLSAGTWITP